MPGQGPGGMHRRSGRLLGPALPPKKLLLFIKTWPWALLPSHPTVGVGGSRLGSSSLPPGAGEPCLHRLSWPEPWPLWVQQMGLLGPPGQPTTPLGHLSSINSSRPAVSSDPGRGALRVGHHAQDVWGQCLRKGPSQLLLPLELVLLGLQAGAPVHTWLWVLAMAVLSQAPWPGAGKPSPVISLGSHDWFSSCCQDSILGGLRPSPLGWEPRDKLCPLFLMFGLFPKRENPSALGQGESCK